MATKWYVGITDNKYVAFKSRIEPTQDSHGTDYRAVIGPFTTKAGAYIMALYGKGNPHLQHVSDAERFARLAKAERGTI